MIAPRYLLIVPFDGFGPETREATLAAMTQQVPQPAAPECYRHPGRETYVRCTRCDRPICPDCMHDASVGHQCPECVAQGRRSQRPVRTVFGGTTAGAHGYVTITLIALNVLAAVLSFISAGGAGAFGGGLGGFLGGSTPLTAGGAIKGLDTFVYTDGSGSFTVPAGIADGEYYRLLSSMFLHYGLLHLAMNMFALWVLGRTLEAVLGPLRFAVLYLVAGLGGGVAVYLFDPGQVTVGASGAVFGLFAALFIIMRKLGRDTSAIVPLLLINLLFSFAPGISLSGHLGGLFTGAAMAAVFAYAPSGRRVTAAAVAVGGLALLFTAAVAAQTMMLTSG